MFQWDAANTGHVARHDVSPEEAEEVVTNNPLYLEGQFRNGEHRIVQLGETTNGRILVVVLTMREDVIRIVTAYPAKRLRKFYLAKRDLQDAQNSKDP